MTQPPGRPDVDALRTKLRTLGYLDAGVDRFVLGSARSGRSGRGMALGASLRIGLLAGVLIGVSGALAIAARVPGLVTGARDALVVALFLGLVVGTAVAVLALAAVVTTSRLVRRGQLPLGRRPRAPQASAALVVLGSLLYLTLLWRATAEGPAWASPAVTAVALLVAVAVSLLLGHATLVTARALAALASEDATASQAERLSWRGSLALAAACFAAAAGLLALTTRQAPAEPPPPALVVVPTGLRLTVVAIDGLDVAFARQALEATPGSTLRRLLAAPSIALDRGPDTDPVRTWTVIATGQPASRHGVAGLEARRVAGLDGRMPTSTSPLGLRLWAVSDLLRLTRPVVSSGVDRREKAFWEVAAAAGLRAAAVNWWATWPATEADGLVLTDRAALRLERGGGLAGEIAPAGLYPALRAAWPKVRDLAASQRAAGTFDGLPAPLAEVLGRSAELDALQVELAQAAVPPGSDVLTVYLPGLDIAAATLLATGPSAPVATDLVRRLDGLARYYRWLDGLVASLAGREPDPRVTMLVGHPGRRPAGNGVVAIDTPEAAAAPPGAGERMARLEDVAPTILYALGVPVSRELPGRVLLALFPSGFREAHRLRLVPTYGRRVSLAERRAQAPVLDDEMRDRLRSLGYVR